MPFAPVVLTGFDLSIDDLVRVARVGTGVAPVVLAPDVPERMAATHAIVERSLQEGAQVYGLSTAVGVLKRVSTTDAAADYSREILRSHRVGQGPLAPRDLVRATMLRLANAFASGVTGVRPELAQRLVDALNADEVPDVRILGSVGQADLAPMADLAAGLFGERARDAGVRITLAGGEGLALAGGEGLALVSSNAFSTAAAALTVHDTERLLDTMTAAGALSLEALRANLSLIHPGIGQVRPYPGLQRALGRLATLLEGSTLREPDAARSLQDPLTFRNLPHLLGVLEDALAHVREQVTIELNASDSNPIVVPGEPAPISVANYESLPVAAALDHVRVVMASVLTASGERSVKLLETPWSGLPTGLVEDSGTRDPGLAYLGIVVQSLVAEARLLAAPVSLAMASTAHAEGIEDRTSMTPLAARRLAEQVALGRRIVAIELAVAAQAVDLRSAERLGDGATTILSLGRGTAAIHQLVRGVVPHYRAGDPIPDLEPLIERLADAPPDQPDRAADQPTSPPLSTAGGLGTAVGSAMLGFEQALRREPPAEILAAEHTPERRQTSGQGDVVITFPDPRDHTEGPDG